MREEEKEMDEQPKDKVVIEIPHTFKIEISQPLIELFGSEEDVARMIHEAFNELLPVVDNAFSALLYPALIAMKSGVADESDLQREISKMFEKSKSKRTDKEGGKVNGGDLRERI